MRILFAFLVSLFMAWVYLLFIQVPLITFVFLGVIAFSMAFWIYPKQTLFGFWVFLLFQPVITIGIQSGIIFFLDEMGLVAMASLLTAKRLITRKPFYWSGIFIPLVLLVLLGGISSIVHQVVPGIISAFGLLLFLKGFLLYYIFLNLDVELSDVLWFKKALYGIGIFTFVYGILAMIWPGIFLWILKTPPDWRFGFPSMQSYLGHPGAFSALMGILLCFAITDRWMHKKFRYTVLIFLFLAGTVLSLRRTSLTGVVLAVGVVLFLPAVRQWIRARISIRAIGLVAAASILFSGIVFVLFRDLIISYMAGDSPRALLLQTGFQIANDFFPLGSGFGTYSGGMNQKFYSPLFYKYRLSTTWGLSEDNSAFINDTFWPHIIAETGYFGLVCYSVIIGIFFAVCLRALKRLRSREAAAFAVTAVMLLVLSLVESTKASFYEMTLWTFFYFGSVAILQSWNRKGLYRHESASGQ